MKSPLGLHVRTASTFLIMVRPVRSVTEPRRMVRCIAFASGFHFQRRNLGALRLAENRKYFVATSKSRARVRARVRKRRVPFRRRGVRTARHCVRLPRDVESFRALASRCRTFARLYVSDVERDRRSFGPSHSASPFSVSPCCCSSPPRFTRAASVAVLAAPESSSRASRTGSPGRRSPGRHPYRLYHTRQTPQFARSVITDRAPTRPSRPDTSIVYRRFVRAHRSSTPRGLLWKRRNRSESRRIAISMLAKKTVERKAHASRE